MCSATRLWICSATRRIGKPRTEEANGDGEWGLPVLSNIHSKGKADQENEEEEFLPIHTSLSSPPKPAIAIGRIYFFFNFLL